MEGLLSAAERLLAREGFVALSTRRIAEEASVSPSLVHYYFPSVDDLCVQLLERVSRALIRRQRRIFSGPQPFSTQINQAFGALRTRRADVKVWVELSMMAVNHPRLKAQMAEIDEEWTSIVRDAYQRQWDGIESNSERLEVAAYAGLTLTFLRGLYFEQVMGLDRQHDQVLVLARTLIENFDGSLVANSGHLPLNERTD